MIHMKRRDLSLAGAEEVALDDEEEEPACRHGERRGDGNDHQGTGPEGGQAETDEREVDDRADGKMDEVDAVTAESAGPERGEPGKALARDVSPPEADQ